MKTLISLTGLLFIAFTTQAQDNKIIGTWNIIECAYVTADGIEKIMQEEINSGTAVTEYVITEDGKYSLKSNMSGSGTLDTYEGTWETSGDKLMMTLSVNGQSMAIEWDFEFNEDVLVLSRTSPDGTLTIANSYRKN